MKKAWMLLPVLLWAGIAWAQTDIYDGQKVWLPHGGVGGGFYMTDSTYHADRTDNVFNKYVREAYPLNQVYQVLNFGIASTSIPYQTRLLGTPVFAGNSAALTLNLQFAAADTDSVALSVYVIGKETSSGSDGLDMAFDADAADTVLTGWFVCSQPAGYTGMASGPSIVVKLKPESSTFLPAAGSPPPLPKFNAVSIPLVSKQGAVPRFQYVNVILVNRARSHNLAGVTADLVLKGN